MLETSPYMIADYGRTSGRILCMRPGVATAIQVEQLTTTNCHRISAIEPGLVVVKRGRKIIQSANHQFVCDEGTAIVFPAGFEADIANEVDGDGRFQALSIAFSQEAVAAHTSVTPALGNITQIGEVCHGLLEAMEHAVTAICDTALPDEIALHRVSELLIWLERRGIRLNSPLQSDLVSSIKRLFAAAPEAAWPAPDVASRLGMSEATLRRRLARSGTSLSKLLLETRMLTALVLLQAGDLPVVQVSYAVGYDSPSRFAVRFRQRFGFAPSELRRRPT